MKHDAGSSLDDAFVASLVAAGRADAADPGARRRALAAAMGGLGAVTTLSAEASTLTATSGTAPSLTSVAATPFSAALAKIALIATVSVAPVPSAPSPSVDVPATHESERPRARVSPSVSPRSNVPIAREVDRPFAAPTATVVTAPARRELPPREGRVQAVPPAAPTTPNHVEATSEDPLLREVARLEAARRALADGDVHSAENLVGSGSPSNETLAPEREVLAIEVLVRAGRLDDARARAAAFPHRFGAGRLAERAARLVERAPR